MSVGIWHDRSWQVICDVHASLPENATLADRKKALKGAYPFGERRYFPYKAWCKAKRIYLLKYEPPKPIPEHELALPVTSTKPMPSHPLTDKPEGRDE